MPQKQRAPFSAGLPCCLLLVALWVLIKPQASMAVRMPVPGGMEGTDTSATYDTSSAGAASEISTVDPAHFKPKPPHGSSRWLLFPSRDVLKWSKSWKSGWFSAFQEYWNYSFLTGPPLSPNSALSGSACLQGQDTSLWITSASDFWRRNVTNQDCTISSSRFKYIYVVIHGTGYLWDPNMLKFKRLMDTALQCTSWALDALARNSTITIKDVNTGKTYYKGSMFPMITRGSWLQNVMQAYEGTCGEGTYLDAGNKSIPFTQGNPNFTLAQGKHVYLYEKGFDGFCGAQGSKPGYLATWPPSAFEITDRGSIFSYTDLTPPIRPNNFPINMVPLNARYPISMSFTSTAFAIDIRRFKASPDYDPSKGLHLSLEWSVNVPDAKVTPTPRDLKTFCTLCPGRCENFCKTATVDGSQDIYDPCKVTSDTRVKTVNITQTPRVYEMKVMLT